MFISQLRVINLYKTKVDEIVFNFEIGNLKSFFFETKDEFDSIMKLFYENVS